MHRLQCYLEVGLRDRPFVEKSDSKVSESYSFIRTMNQNTTSRQNSRITVGLLAAILLVAGYLRLFNLGVPSFWVDELDFVVAAESKKEVGEPLLYSGYAYPRSPLLTYAVMASTSVFGVSEFASRLPVAIFGILTIPVVFWIGRRWFNTRVGLIAATLVAISPFAIGWSRTCRMYSLFQLLFLIAMYLVDVGLEGKSGGTAGEHSKSKLGLWRRPRLLPQAWGIHLPSLIWGGLFLLLSYSTHQNTGLFLLSFLGYVLVLGAHDAYQNGFRRAFKNKYLFLATSILALGAVAFALLPFVKEFVMNSVFYQPKWAEVATAQNQWRIIEFFVGAQKFPFDWLFVCGAIFILRKNHRSGIYSLITLLVPVLMFSFLFQYRKNDYIFHVYPIFYLVGAYALDRLIVAGGRAIDKLRSKDALRKLLANSRAESLLVALCLIWIPLTFNFRFAQKIPRLPDGRFNGAVYHNEWRELASFMQDKIREQDVVISTLPLTVLHYLERADYNLNWSNADLARQNNNRAQDGRLIDFYSGADIIEDLDELKKLARDHSEGWVLVDNYRFTKSVYVPDEVRAYLASRTKRVFESRNKTVSAFQWTEKSYLSGTN